MSKRLSFVVGEGGGFVLLGRYKELDRAIDYGFETLGALLSYFEIIYSFKLLASLCRRAGKAEVIPLRSAC
jgi:hypothetical protein